VVGLSRPLFKGRTETSVAGALDGSDGDGQVGGGALGMLAQLVVGRGLRGQDRPGRCLRDLAVASGIEERLAWIWPLVVDGFICVATVAAVLLRPRGWRIAWYPWVTLAMAACVSVAGNALHAASHADLSRV
jgi:hypothetical protein